MKKNYSFNQLFLLFFLVFFIKNNIASELASSIWGRVKNKTPILRAPSMQLSFGKYNNLFTLYLGQQLFKTSKIQNLMIGEEVRLRKIMLSLLGINNNFENYFAQNLKDKKYINFSRNILWYFFSTYAFFLKSDRFKKVINSKEYLYLFDKKIKEFVPFFNLMYPFATFLEDKYFERKEEAQRKKRQGEEGAAQAETLRE